MCTYEPVALESSGNLCFPGCEQAIPAATGLPGITRSAPEMLWNIKAKQMINNSLLALSGIIDISTIGIRGISDICFRNRR